jgi:hypothetical protein
MTGTGMKMPWMMAGTQSATFNKSGPLPSAVIIFQSVQFHSMFNSLAP